MPIIIKDGYKPCPKCSCTTRNVTLNERGKTVVTRCRDCAKRYAKEYVKKNSTAIAEKRKIDKQQNPEKWAAMEARARELRRSKDGKIALLVRSARTRAKSKGWEHNITIGDIVPSEICPLLGINLNWSNGATRQDSPTLDRIDTNKGYIRGNVWVISHKANSIKNNATYKEFITIAKNWEKANQYNMFK